MDGAIDPRYPPRMTLPFDASVFAGPLAVTLAYLGLYYGFQLHIARTKARLHRDYKARDEKFDRYFGQDREMLAADRFQLNMLEHMPPFQILLWLTAVFVGTTQATVAGGIYVAARCLYPFAMGGRLGRDVKTLIFLATGPGYIVLAYFFATLVMAAF